MASPKQASGSLNVQLLVDSIPALIHTARPDGYLDYFNKRWLEYLGVTLDAVLGWNWKNLVHSEDVDGIVNRWMECVATGKVFEYETRVRRADGVYRWMFHHKVPLRDERGDIVKWYGTSLDIDDRKQAAEALRLRELDARSLLDNMPGFLARHSPDGTPEIVNQPFLQYLGKTVEEIGQWRTSDLVHPDDLARVVEDCGNGISGGEPWGLDFRLRRFDGVYRWFRARWVPVRDREGRLLHWNALTTDIDDRKKAQEALQSSQRNLSLLVNVLPTIIVELSTDGLIAYVNQAALDYTGLTLEAVQKGDFRSRVFHPEDVERLREERREALLRPVPFENEQRVLRKDGQYRWFLIRYNPLLDENGRIDRWYVAGFDIEDRKKAEEALQSSQRNLSEIINAIPTSIGVMGADGSPLYGNQAVTEYTGLALEDMSKRDFRTRIFHPEDLETQHQERRLAFTRPQPFETEQRVLGKDGKYRWFLFRYKPQLDEAGKIDRWYMAAFEIEDRKRAEEALQSNERNLTLMINTIPSFIHTGRPDGYLDYFNKPWLEYLGAALDDVVGWKWRSFIHPGDVDGIVGRWLECLATGEVFESEARVRRADGEYRWMFHRKVPLRDDNGNIVRWYGCSFDIEDRKRAEEQLRRSGEFLAEGQNLAGMGNFAWTVATGEIQWSAGLYRIFEFEVGATVTLELIGSRVHPEDQHFIHDMVEAAQSGVSSYEYEHRILLPDSSIKHLHLVAHASRDRLGRLEYIGAVQDVTQRRLSEEALAKARSELANVSRVTSMGVLTAAIAHEVNQPLSGIITNASTCLRMLSAEPPNVEGARETCRRTMRDGNRASDVITRLRALYTRKDLAPEITDLNEAAREVASLLLSDLQRNRVTLCFELADELPAIAADRIQLQQVILNLLRNASEAMSTINDRPRELFVKTERHEGDSVRLSIRDTGIGFAAQAAEKLFEPLYTTKSDGMGIGLSVSRSIIERHQGRLWAEPNIGPGATFSFSIPCKAERTADAASR